MKPKLISLYECSNGATAKTLAEWKTAEVSHLLNGLTAAGISTNMIIENADALIEILSVKDKGRPLNRKDSKPRKPRVVAGEEKVA